MSIISNRTEMKASPEEVFHVIADLATWPTYLRHYRWIRVMENHPDHQVVRMACYRSGIPLDWLSRFSADPVKKELRFTHLKALTRGLEVVWRLEPIREGRGTRVTITHDLEPVIQRRGKWFAERVVGDFFIQHVARRTLGRFADYFEKKQGKESLSSPEKS